jgi:hypothetical protein
MQPLAQTARGGGDGQGGKQAQRAVLKQAVGQGGRRGWAAI